MKPTKKKSKKEETIEATKYLKKAYGIDPIDLDLQDVDFDIEEVERLALKYDLDRIDGNAYGF
jgi:hypothetical protein